MSTHSVVVGATALLRKQPLGTEDMNVSSGLGRETRAWSGAAW